MLNDIAGTHAASILGVATLTEHLRPQGENPPSLDSMFLVGHGDPNTPEAFTYQAWPLATLLDRLDPDGPVFRVLGQQWLVMVAAQWNDHYRQRLADALGVSLNEVADPVMADITRMRHDVIHHRGVASARNTGRCEKLRWFRPGEPIHVMAVHVAEFMGHWAMVRTTDQIDGGEGPWEVRGSVGQ